MQLPSDAWTVDGCFQWPDREFRQSLLTFANRERPQFFDEILIVHLFRTIKTSQFVKSAQKPLLIKTGHLLSGQLANPLQISQY